MAPIKGPAAKELKFIEYYLASFDKVQSYKAAGFKARKGTEAAEADTLLEKHREVLLEMSKAKASETVVDGNRVIAELSYLAFSSIADACTWDSGRLSLVPSSSLAPHQLAAVKKISIKPGEFGTEFSVEMHDKKAALATLAKHFNVDCNMNELIARIRSYGFEVQDSDSPEANSWVNLGQK
jgi:hypothetical protein